MSRMPAKKSLKMLAPSIASPVTIPRCRLTRFPSTTSVVTVSISWFLVEELFRDHDVNYPRGVSGGKTGSAATATCRNDYVTIRTAHELPSALVSCLERQPQQNIRGSRAHPTRSKPDRLRAGDRVHRLHRSAGAAAGE